MSTGNTYAKRRVDGKYVLIPLQDEERSRDNPDGRNHLCAPKLKAVRSPFATKGKDQAVTTWVKPSLVAEVKITEWTSSGEMRHPVYLGLRSDKRAQDVTRERERSAPVTYGAG